MFVSLPTTVAGVVCCKLPPHCAQPHARRYTRACSSPSLDQDAHRLYGITITHAHCCLGLKVQYRYSTSLSPISLHPLHSLPSLRCTSRLAQAHRGLGQTDILKLLYAPSSPANSEIAQLHCRPTPNDSPPATTHCATPRSRIADGHSLIQL